MQNLVHRLHQPRMLIESLQDRRRFQEWSQSCTMSTKLRCHQSRYPRCKAAVARKDQNRSSQPGREYTRRRRTPSTSPVCRAPKGSANLPRSSAQEYRSYRRNDHR